MRMVTGASLATSSSETAPEGGRVAEERRAGLGRTAFGIRMKKAAPEPSEIRDATLRVSKHTRDRLKAAAAVQGRPLYDVTNELIESYLRGLKIPDLKALRRQARDR
jgi:hypothetical protein